MTEEAIQRAGKRAYAMLESDEQKWFIRDDSGHVLTYRGHEIARFGEHDGKMVAGFGNTGHNHIWPMSGAEITDADIEEAAVLIVEALRHQYA